MRKNLIRLYSSPTRFWMQEIPLATWNKTCQFIASHAHVYVKTNQSLVPGGPTAWQLPGACQVEKRLKTRLQGRARQGPFVGGGEREDGSRGGAAPVFDAVRLVQDYAPPPHLICEQGVCGAVLPKKRAHS